MTFTAAHHQREIKMLLLQFCGALLLSMSCPVNGQYSKWPFIVSGGWSWSLLYPCLQSLKSQFHCQLRLCNRVSMFCNIFKDWDPQKIHHIGAGLTGGIVRQPLQISDTAAARLNPKMPSTDVHTIKNSDHWPCPLQAGRITGMIHLSWTKPPTLSSMSWCSSMCNKVFSHSKCCPAAQSFLPQSVSLSTPLTSSILTLGTLNLYATGILYILGEAYNVKM